MPNPVVLEASFSPKLKVYRLINGVILMIVSIVMIPLIPFWLLFGPAWVRRVYEGLGCVLTERSLVVRSGVIIKREMTIPLDKIQDISLSEGPLLRRLGLLILRIETAGQSSAAGTSDANLIGLVDARMVRDRILAQRDLFAEQTTPTQSESPSRHLELLEEIRNALHRIEQGMSKK